MKKSGILCMCLFLFSINLDSQSRLSELFLRFEVIFEHPIENIFTEDLNQDGLKDLLIVTNAEEKRLHQIFFQKEAGFSQTPDQVLAHDESAILFDIGDISDEYSGKEIVYLTRDSLYCYHLKESHYQQEPERLIDIPSILQSPSPECPVRAELIYTLEDGSKFLLIPGPDTAAIIYCQSGKSMEIQNIHIRSNFITSTEFRSSQEDTGIGDFAQKISVRVPLLYIKDFNGDKRQDIISVYKDKIKVFFNHEDGRFSINPDFEIDLEVLTEEEKKKALKPLFKAEAVDLDSNGLTDFIVTKITIKTTTGITKVYIHLNQDGRINKIPDQIMVFESSFGYPQILDLNADNHKDLIISELKFGFIQLIKILITKKASFKEGVFLWKGGKFPSFPDFKLKSHMEFDFENPEIKGDLMHFGGDFNGDGIKDLLKSSSSDNKLYIFHGDLKNQKIYSKKANLEIKESELPMELILKDLNNDKITDILFDFKRAKKKNLVIYLSR